MATNERALDQFNQQLRANPEYQAFLRSMGVNTSGPITLTDAQRKQAEAWVSRNVSSLGKLEIDPAANANQNEGFGRQLGKWGPIAGAGALAAFGMPGLFPGLLSGGAAAGGGALASSSIPTSLAMQAVPGAAAGAGAAGAGAGLWAGLGSAMGGLGSQMLKSLASPQGIASLASIVPALMSRGGGGGGGLDSLLQQQPQINQLLGMSAERAQRTDPLHQAVTSLALSRMPVSSRPKG